MSSTLWHVRQEIKRFTDPQLIELKGLVDAEHTRRFEAEKQSKQVVTNG